MGVEVKNLGELITRFIPNKTVISTDVDFLTAPGENYVSVVVGVDAFLKDDDTGKVEKLSMVGKCVPIREGHQEAMNFGKENYKSELNFYQVIVPTLQEFAKERGLKRDFDLFPKLVAYRANLHGENDEPDENCILLFENLSVDGKFSSKTDN